MRIEDDGSMDEEKAKATRGSWRTHLIIHN
jgi:hypothetical protein